MDGSSLSTLRTEASSCMSTNCMVSDWHDDDDDDDDDNDDNDNDDNDQIDKKATIAASFCTLIASHMQPRLAERLLYMLVSTVICHAFPVDCLSCPIR